MGGLTVVWGAEYDGMGGWMVVWVAEYDGKGGWTVVWVAEYDGKGGWTVVWVAEYDGMGGWTVVWEPGQLHVHLHIVVYYTCIIKYIYVLYCVRGPSTSGADDA